MRALIATVTLTLALTSDPALAIDRPEQEAREVFKKGVAAFNEGLLSDALASFKRAYALRPSFRILFNIGQVEAELKHYDLALEAFEGYLAQGGDRIEKDRRATVEKETERLRKLIGEVLIRGTKGGEVWIDGERKGILPLAASIPLTAGTHELIVRRGTLPPCQKTIRVRGGQPSEEICLLLDESEFEPSKDDSKPLSSRKEFQVNTDHPRGGNFLRNVAPWLTAGLGLVTFTTGAVCALRTASLNRSLESNCPGGSCPPDQRQDMEKLPRLAAAADGMFIATAVLSGLSALLFSAPWEKKNEGE